MDTLRKWMERYDEKKFAGLAGCPKLCDLRLNLFLAAEVSALKQPMDRGGKHSRTAASVVAYQHGKLTHAG